MSSSDNKDRQAQKRIIKKKVKKRAEFINSVMENLTAPFIVGVNLLRHLKGKVYLTANEVVFGSERTPFAGEEKAYKKNWAERSDAKKCCGQV